MEHKKRVIIVDDDKDLLDMLVFAFEAEGFDVIGLHNGKEGIEFLSNKQNLEHVRLLILDRMLPDMDGLEILRQLEPSTIKQIPVLFLSVLSSEKDVLSGLRYGAIDYVAKPFSLPVLLGKALALINRGI